MDRNTGKHGARHQNSRVDEMQEQREDMTSEGGLPEAAVGQSQNPPTGQGQPDQPRSDRRLPVDVGSRDQERGSLSRDEEGERDTEIRRETQYQDATASPINDEVEREQKDQKITRDKDLFGREGEA